jgi:hypothetical protein
MTAPVSRETVREFMITIAAQAKAALAGMEKPGYLQMSRLHPTSEKLVPSRYKLDDVERMIADAIAADRPATTSTSRAARSAKMPRAAIVAASSKTRLRSLPWS